MASLPFTIVLSLLLFFAGITSAAHHHRNLHTDNNNDIIQEACKASPEPPKCQASLSGKQLPPNATVSQVIRSALWISSQHLETARKMVHAILEDASTANKNRTDVASTCLQLLRYSNYRVKLARRNGGGRIKDARAWVSAALAYQYGCWSGLQKVNDTSAVVQTVDFFGSSLLGATSDALGMMLNYDIFGDKTGVWGPPKTERDGFWGNGSDSPESGSVGGVPAGLKVNVTVCKGGNESSSSCDYRTVQEAVNAAPNNPKLGKRFVIWIKSGVYEETVRIPLRKKNVILLGDGMGKTVITGSMSVGLQGGSTYNTATVGVLGDGFMAKDLTIQNTAGANANQAVAFRSDSDLSIIQNCEFIGNQDTLYAHSLRQYYKSCRIQGNVDFIFGNSASVFQDCLILIAPRQLNPEKSETNAITAHGRTDPAESTGFVFQNCVINGTDAYMALYNSNPSVHKNFLGRPWKQYSRTVFVRCTLEALISPDGWMPWSGDFALKTLYYGEFENRGPGSNRSKRVSWSSSVPAEQVEKYSVQNFIQGDRWIPTS